MPLPISPTFNHVGITVPDLDRAVAWYRDVLHLEVVGGPLEVHADDKPFGEVLQDIFGSSWGGVRVAFLATSEGVGFELFEFVEPATVTTKAEYWRTGPFHLCFTWPNVAELVHRICEHGGRKTSKVWTLFPSRDVVYCEDPFGNILEISSGSFERTWANRDTNDNEGSVG
ncbi:VOC family protein [Rhodococcus sp. NPDC003318]|uniref:VOC family protein n=1 Tax=Rhodococcus sp. NPDC003318 TaxID=3364503 RepID=UPI0036A0909F